MILKHDIEYEVVPRMYEQHCFAWKIQEDEPKLFTAGVGPLGAGADGDNLLRALPDVRGWAYGGEDSLEDGRPAQLWVHELRCAHFICCICRQMADLPAFGAPAGGELVLAMASFM